MKDRKTFCFSAFRYVVPADYEKWFEDLAAQGWHPQKVGQWSSILMRFKKSEPKKYRYVVDMQPFQDKNYRQTYEDFGWEFVGQMASAVVWRKEYQTTRPESFSDAEGRRARNRRFIGAVSVSFVIFLLGGIASLAGLIIGRSDTIDTLELGIVCALCFAAAAALGLVMKKIRKDIDK